MDLALHATGLQLLDARIAEHKAAGTFKDLPPLPKVGVGCSEHVPSGRRKGADDAWLGFNGARKAAGRYKELPLLPRLGEGATEQAVTRSLVRCWGEGSALLQM